ncbi:hypothetical protein BH23PLA1_BH23PLA1_43330 [soil metagenome]
MDELSVFARDGSHSTLCSLLFALFEVDQPVRILSEHDELSLPGLLGDFRVAIRRFLVLD